MQTLTDIERDVLNATAEHRDNLERIYRQLQHAPRAVPLAEAADAVRSLVDKGLLAPRLGDNDPPLPAPIDPGNVWKAEFEMTPRGREILEDSVREAASAQPVAPPEGRLYFGIWRDLDIHLTREDIDEARREMWRNFPRDFPA